MECREQVFGVNYLCTLASIRPTEVQSVSDYLAPSEAKLRKARLSPWLPAKACVLLLTTGLANHLGTQPKINHHT
jgi:hypothetical protein